MVEIIEISGVTSCVNHPRLLDEHFSNNSIIILFRKFSFPCLDYFLQHRLPMRVIQKFTIPITILSAARTMRFLLLVLNRQRNFY